MLIKKLLKLKDGVITDKIFSHYWTNDGENFPDVEDIEEYITNFYPQYEWVECPNARRENNSIQYCKLELRSSELSENRYLFLKIEDGEYVEKETSEGETYTVWVPNEIPMYYFCKNYKYVSDDNYPEQTYEAMLELDMWATFGCRMHAIMKKTSEPILFKNKMMDRFLRDPSGTGYYVDYLKQPWLNYSNGDGEILYRYEKEPTLSYTDWLYINSGDEDIMSKDSWIKDVWFTWIKQQVTGGFDLANANFASIPSDVTKTSSINVTNFFQNASGLVLGEKYQIFDDDYNSNGKYKWLVTRTGNNTVISGSTTGKHAMFPKYTTLELPIYRNFYDDTYKANDITYFQNKYITLKSNNIEFGDAEKLWYSVKYTSTIDVAEQQSIVDVTKLCFQPITKLFTNPTIQLTVNKKAIYISDHIDTKLNFEEYTTPFVSPKLLVEFNAQKVYIPSLEEVVTIYPNLYFRINTEFNKTKSVSFILTFNFEFQDDSELTINDLDLSLESLELKSREVKVGTETKTFYSFELLNPEKAFSTMDQESFTLNGEQLMLIPLRKGLLGQQWIKQLNNDSEEIILGENLTIGMPVNDIPPTVLSIALRRYANDNLLQANGDLIGIRDSDAGINPTDFVTIASKEWAIPVIFNTLDYIPVTIAMSPSYNKFDYIFGGSAFLNTFYSLLVNDSLINDKDNGNTIDNDPVMYNPHIWKWIYYIDGKNTITLTPDQIDTKKMVNTDWRVNMNINMTDVSNYRLDISQIKNDAYPFTKSFIELTASDSTSHPYSTEQYNNWLEGNQLTVETSKNAELTIPNKWAKTNWAMQLPGMITGNIGGGAATGAKIGGPWGALAGAIVGTAESAIEGPLSWLGLQNKIKASEEQWQNKWDGELGNKYSAPATLNPSGFEKGSLIWSDTDPSDTSDYSLMRTFKPNDYSRTKIWDFISTNGYPVMAEFKYSEYDNRENFNIVNCNPANKEFYFRQTLYNAMKDETTLFSHSNAISWFLMKCRDGLRLFLEDYSFENMDKLIKGNVEHKSYTSYKPKNYYDIYDNVNIFPLSVSHTLAPGTLSDYALEEDKKTFLRTTSSDPVIFELPYNHFHSSITTLTAFKENYAGFGGDHFGSSVSQTVYVEDEKKDVKLTDEVNQETFTLFDNIDIDKFEQDKTYTDIISVGNIDNWTNGSVYCGDKVSSEHKVGYKLSITPNETSLVCQLEEYDAFIFDEEVTETEIKWTDAKIQDDVDPGEAYKNVNSSVSKRTGDSKPNWVRNGDYVIYWENKFNKTILTNANKEWATSDVFKRKDFYYNKDSVSKIEIHPVNSERNWINLRHFDKSKYESLKNYIDSVTYEFNSNYDVTFSTKGTYPTDAEKSFDGLKVTNANVKFTGTLDIDNWKLNATSFSYTETNDGGAYYKSKQSMATPGWNGVARACDIAWKFENDNWFLGLTHLIQGSTGPANGAFAPFHQDMTGFDWQDLNNDLRITYNSANVANHIDKITIKFHTFLSNLRENYTSNLLKLYLIRKI